MIFEQQLFKRFWHLVCHRREIQNHGDFVRFDSPCGEVVVFNDNNSYVAFDNLCPHRGARIYSADFGNQAASCQYHGWTYFNGKILVPNKADFNNCDVNKASYNTYLLDWCGDFLFVGISPSKSLYTQLDATAEVLENISLNIEARHDFSRYKYECFWPLAIENALEPYHISMIHPNTLATLELSDGKNVLCEDNSIWYAPIGNSRIQKQIAGLSRFSDIDYKYEGYISIYLFPFTIISSTYGLSYSLQNFFPSSPTDQTEYTNFTSRLLTVNAKSDRAREILKPFFDATAVTNRQVFEEDHSICKKLPKSSWNFNRPKYSADSEIKLLHFRDICKKFSLSLDC